MIEHRLMDDDATSELVWLDSDQRVSISTRPSFEVERSEPLTFVGITYAASAAGDYHTPTFAHGFIDTIYLKAYQLPLDSGGFGFVGAEYDLALGKFEIHGQRHGTSFAHENDASNSSHRQMCVALLRGECFQEGVSPGAPVPRRPIDFSTHQCDRCRFEGERHQLQSASTERCIRTSFEVCEVHRIDTSA